MYYGDECLHDYPAENLTYSSIPGIDREEGIGSRVP
jgi:hypothetical protein